MTIIGYLTEFYKNNNERPKYLAEVRVVENDEVIYNGTMVDVDELNEANPWSQVQVMQFDTAETFNLTHYRYLHVFVI